MIRVVRRKLIIISALVLTVLAVIAGGVLIVLRDDTIPSPENNYPEFVFRGEQAPGWYSYGNFAPEFDEPAYPRDLLASTNVHKGESGKPGECFVIYSYKTGTIDVDVSLQEKQDKVIFGDKSVKLQPLGIEKIRMRALAADATYDLHQYDLQGAESRQAMRGLAFGFVPLDGGYIEVSVNCNTRDGLPSVLPILPSVELRSKESLPADICHPKDWSENNCVPAGKCGPTPEIDQRIDCAIKDYDKKYNLEL